MVSFQLKHFNELSTKELFDLYQLRQEVFIVEQNCPYLDADKKDIHCHHVLGYDDKGEIQSYARLVPIGISYPKHNSIGRVVTSRQYRGKGEGKLLMEYAIQSIRDLYPSEMTKISAQTYAIAFYEKLGFVPTGDEYDEDGIPHVAMVLK